MLTLIVGICIGFWILLMGWRFYQSVDWNEPAESGPDLHAFRKREAELLHIQGVLAEAHGQGKLTAAVLEEFNRFCQGEIESMNAQAVAWKNRPRPTPPQ